MWLQCKTVAVGPEMSARCVTRHALHVLQNGGSEPEEGETEGENESEGRWGNASEFVLYVRMTRDAPPTPLQGIERPHAIQVRILLRKLQKRQKSRVLE